MNNRKAVRVLIAAIFLSIFVFLIYVLVVRIKDSSRHLKAGSYLPVFEFKTLDGRNYKSIEIESGPLIIVHFHPDCEHCQYQIDDLLKNVTRINDLKLLLISSAEKDSISKFLESRIDHVKDNLTVLIDDSIKFDGYFNSNSIPCLFVYSKDLRLIRQFDGEVKSETLIKCLTNASAN